MRKEDLKVNMRVRHVPNCHLKPRRNGVIENLAPGRSGVHVRFDDGSVEYVDPDNLVRR